ncbi:NTTRR-F1 domain [Bacillus carboniphilus]|uniref:NTTRR-F1 domain n=1 Tax=Bacillus carboniphilus TaxID=86663 RepID=A0ABY9JY34_9BACI|nr:NTTRR-F1 domain [Bacillus carboniphilus]WLR43248.1 NTTRR-F1 domain [Bacillus carboniphilus]
MALIQNLIVNGRFQRGELSPWTGENACTIDHPCPTVEGQYSAALKSGKEKATLEQFINVVKDESYSFSISLAANEKGTSPTVSIILQFLDLNFNFIENGLSLTVEEGQLPNGKDGTFNTIVENTTSVPQDAAFIKLVITKKGSLHSTGVIVDNVVLNRIQTELQFDIPSAYVGNTGEESVSIVPTSSIIIQLISGNPVAMVLIDNNVYVANGNTISVIDTETNTVSENIPLDFFISYQANRNILTNSDESIVYVCAGQSTDSFGLVGKIDTSTASREAQITVGLEPVALALTSNEETLYVLNKTDSTVSVVDTSLNVSTVSFSSLLGNPSFLQLTPDNSKLIIGYESIPGFAVYNVPENTINQFIDFPASLIMRSIGLSLDDSRVYMGCSSSSGVAFLSYGVDDLSLNQILLLSSNTSASPNTFVQVADSSSNTSFIYVGEAGTNLVWQIQDNFSSQTLTVITNVSVKDFNSGFIALSKDSNWIVTANEGDNSASYLVTASTSSTFYLFNSYSTGSSPQVLVVT